MQWWRRCRKRPSLRFVRIGVGRLKAGCGLPVKATALMRLNLADAAGTVQDPAGILAPKPCGGVGFEPLDERGIAVVELVAQEMAAVDQGREREAVDRGVPGGVVGELDQLL